MLLFWLVVCLFNSRYLYNSSYLYIQFLRLLSCVIFNHALDAFLSPEHLVAPNRGTRPLPKKPQPTISKTNNQILMYFLIFAIKICCQYSKTNSLAVLRPVTRVCCLVFLLMFVGSFGFCLLSPTEWSGFGVVALRSMFYCKGNGYMW